MELALPALNTTLLRTWSLRILALMMIWGGCIFLWGSISAWGELMVDRDNLHLLQRHKGDSVAWLKTLTAPIDRLSKDRRVMSGLATPAGVSSVPVQRVLSEFGFGQSQSDIYAIDLTSGKVGSIMGAAAIPEEIVAKIKELAPKPQMMVGAGKHNGMVYLAAAVSTPPPQQVYVVMPLTLARAAVDRPKIELSDNRQLGLLLPHTAGVAWWPEGKERFDIEQPGDALPETMRRTADDYLPLAGVQVALLQEGLTSHLSLIPQLMVVMVAIGLSLAVLWQPIAPLRNKVSSSLEPVLRVVDKVLGPIVGPLVSLHRKMMEKLDQINNPPLIDGPGAFVAADFLDGRAPTPKVWGSNKRGGSGGSSGGGGSAGGSKTFSAQRMPSSRIDVPVTIPEAPVVDESQNLTQVVLRALHEGRVELLYQPIFNITTKQVVMHEIYARLLDNDGKVMLPGVFLPILNQNGLTDQLDAVVLRKTLATNFRSSERPNIPLALNIGGNSLDSIAYLQELVNQGPLVLGSLVFEVRSQEIVRDPKALRLLKELQALGGKLSVDYFGGGSPMLEASKAMALDFVKLDASRFVGTDKGKEELIALCKKSRELGLPVVLEKIEDEATEKLAQEHGVELMQGYRFAKPDSKMNNTALDKRNS